MREITHIIGDVAPLLGQLEPRRLHYLKRSRIYLAILFIPLVLLLAAGFIAEMSLVFFIGAGLWFIIGMILYHYRAGSLGQQYRQAYKDSVIPRLVAAIDSQLAYDGGSGIPSDVFVGTELFTTSPDRYRTEDLIHGICGKTFLQLAEVDAEERRTTTDSKGNTQTTYVTIFKGLLLIADFHKHFQGRTFVLPDVAESFLGNFGRLFQKLGGRSETNLMRLEDPDFENAFVVYATDEIEARYILSTAMMQRLLKMRERFGKDVRIGFKESSIVLAVPHSDGFLEPSTKVPATETQQINDMLAELETFLDLIEELDLNTRIWTKE